MIPQKDSDIKISEYNYDLPDEKIAKFPVAERDESRLLVYRNGNISETIFKDLGSHLPAGTTLVFNNTKVIRARIIMHKTSGARIEIFCLEPHEPADYERAISATGQCRWQCMVGNLKKWKEGALVTEFEYEGSPYRLSAYLEQSEQSSQIVRFEWDNPHLTFGQLLEHLWRIPIPPYLGRDSESSDNVRYQTVYSKYEGSVAAPTAGLHFTPQLLSSLQTRDFKREEVTLHVGAGTFLPVKTDDPVMHTMHTEHFEIRLSTIRNLTEALKSGHITAVGTTTVRTIESLPVLGYRVLQTGSPDPETTIGQWEAYEIPDRLSGIELLEALSGYMQQNNLDTIKASTRIMIMPGFRYRLTRSMITNFHQPCSTLLLLVGAFIGDSWKEIYEYALSNGFRFLSYGDSSLLIP